MITVTDKASKKIKQNLEKRGKGVGIRIGVKTTGCSGLAYVLEYVDKYEHEVGVTNYAQNDFVVLVHSFPTRRSSEIGRASCRERVY